MKSLFFLLAQILFFVILAKTADLLVNWLHLPIPGSIVGIALLFALLKLKIIRLSWIERGSKWLLAEMLLFFVPAAVGIIKYQDLVIHSGLFIFLTIALSSLAVMSCSGLIGQWMSMRREKGVN